MIIEQQSRECLSNSSVVLHSRLKQVMLSFLISLFCQKQLCHRCFLTLCCFCRTISLKSCVKQAIISLVSGVFSPFLVLRFASGKFWTQVFCVLQFYNQQCVVEAALSQGEGGLYLLPAKTKVIPFQLVPQPEDVGKQLQVNTMN